MKLTYDYVKTFIESKGYQLLSDTYKNAHVKLLLKCPIGHEYEVKFNNFKSGNRCPICASNKKLSYNYVKSFIENSKYQLLSDTYKNNISKLLLKCPNNHICKISFSNFKKGRRCSICAGNKKPKYNDVKSFIENKVIIRYL